MGNSSWSSDAYSTLKSTYSKKSTSDIFTTTGMSSTLDPKKIKTFRESRDSAEHPNTLAIMIWLDVTGSMSSIPAYLVKNKLNVVLETLINHGFVDAQVLFGAIGDHVYDSYPLQVGQFESGTAELDKCLTSINLEGGGGGNEGESYLLSWLIAGRYTSIDCFEKRKQKGVLFTIGDEPCLTGISGSKIKELLGLSESCADVTAEQLLQEAQRMYHVFHIQVSDGRGDYSYVINKWRSLIGERLIVCENKDLIPELIATTVAACNGADIETIASTFDPIISSNIIKALHSVNTTSDTSALTTKSNSGVIKF